MTRAQFLNDLYRRLAGNGMDADQAEQHLTYYAEMLADRMEEGMTEEQAVSGMEDVDTIARRILEEEGKSYQPVEAVAPPASPDVSPGGEGKRAYQAPKKWNRRTLVQAAVWALAILIAFGAFSRWAWKRNVRSWNSDTPIDTTSSAVRETAPIAEVPAVPDAPYTDWEYALELPYEYGDYEYSSGINEVSDPVKELDIQWAAGTVYIQSCTGDEIQFQEYSRVELNERNAMQVKHQDGKLSISYSGTGLRNVKGGKYLVVLLPDGMLEELDIETASANVQLLELEQGELDVSTASGCIDLIECYLSKADLESISGEVNLSSIYADELDVSTTSGGVSGTAYCRDVEADTVSGEINLNSCDNVEKVKLSTISGEVWYSVDNAAIRSIEVDTTSGGVSLGLPYDMGFTLEYDTVSGSLRPSGFDLVQQAGKSVYNGGGCEIKVDTVSGDLEIY